MYVSKPNVTKSKHREGKFCVCLVCVSSSYTKLPLFHTITAAFMMQNCRSFAMKLRQL